MVLLTFSPDTEVADMNMCLDCGGAPLWLGVEVGAGFDINDEVLPHKQ